MRLVSLHTCTANDSIKEALKRAFLSLNDITIRFDGRQPRSLIRMRKLAINQHLDLPEHIHEDDTTPEGEWRYSELQASVDCTAPTTSHRGYSHITVVCWSRKVSETAALSGHGHLAKMEWNLCLQGFWQNAVIVHPWSLSSCSCRNGPSWTFGCRQQYKVGKVGQSVDKIKSKYKKENSTRDEEAAQRKARCGE